MRECLLNRREETEGTTEDRQPNLGATTPRLRSGSCSGSGCGHAGIEMLRRHASEVNSPYYRVVQFTSHARS